MNEEFSRLNLSNDAGAIRSTTSERLLNDVYIPREYSQPAMPALDARPSLSSSVELPRLELSTSADKPSGDQQLPSVSINGSLTPMPQMFPGLQRSEPISGAADNTGKNQATAADNVSNNQAPAAVSEHHATHHPVHVQHHHHHHALKTASAPQHLQHEAVAPTDQIRPVLNSAQVQAEAREHFEHRGHRLPATDSQPAPVEKPAQEDDNLFKFEVAVNKSALRKIEEGVSSAVNFLPNLFIAGEHSAISAGAFVTESAAQELHAFARGLESLLPQSDKEGK